MAWGSKRWRNSTTDHVTSAGDSYRWHYETSSRYRAARSKVSISANVPIDFRIAKENSFHRFAKWLSFASEFQTGDDKFDETYYIESDDASFWHLLGTPDVRRSVHRIFVWNGCTELAARHGRLTVTMARATPDPAVAEADDLVPHLLAIGSRIAEIPCSDGSRGRTLASSATVAMTTITGLGVAAVTVGGALPYQLVAKGPMIAAALFFALLPIVLALFVIQMRFAGSARGASVLGTFLAVGVAGTAVATYDALYAVNFYYDTAESRIATQRIDGTEVDSGRYRRYYLRTADPSRPNRTLRLPSSEYLNEFVHRGDEIRIEIHPGRLGFPWIGDYHVELRTQESFDRAAVVYRRECDRGSPGDCFFLGKAYREGRGVARDLALAAELFGCAATGRDGSL